jgi:hypothetical protein
MKKLCAALLVVGKRRVTIMAQPTPEALARAFHETYERLAPSFGYETRRDSAVPWEQVPEANRRLMIAVCAELLDTVLARPPAARASQPQRKNQPKPQP